MTNQERPDETELEPEAPAEDEAEPEAEPLPDAEAETEVEPKPEAAAEESGAEAALAAPPASADAARPARPATAGGYRGALPPRGDRIAAPWLAIVVLTFVMMFVLAFLDVPSRFFAEEPPPQVPVPTTDISPDPSPAAS